MKDPHFSLRLRSIPDQPSSKKETPTSPNPLPHPTQNNSNSNINIKEYAEEQMLKLRPELEARGLPIEANLSLIEKNEVEVQMLEGEDARDMMRFVDIYVQYIAWDNVRKKYEDQTLAREEIEKRFEEERERCFREIDVRMAYGCKIVGWKERFKKKWLVLR
jgi:hypothetical protein